MKISKEDKELLLRDLCARLPYNVCILYDNGDTKETREMGFGSLHDFMFNDAIVRPYLRPMSDMTKEEAEMVYNLKAEESFDELFDYYNERFFDFRGLVPMGLALPATKDMYNIKDK